MSYLKIKAITSSNSLIRVNKKTAKLLNLSKRKNIIISYGSRQLETSIEKSKNVPDDRVEIDQRTIERLLINTGVPYDYKYENGRFIIGPVIGLLFCHKEQKLRDLLHDKETKKRYIPYSEIMGSLGGLVYFFTLDQINYESEEINGYVYDVKSSTWKKKLLPYPGIIYRKVSVSKELKEKMEGKIFNSYRFNKFKFWEMVKGDPQLCAHLPETTNDINKSSLDYLLDKYGKVLLKHKNKKLGYGIYHITKEKHGYMVTKNLTYSPYYVSDDEMVSFLVRRKKYFILQQFILLKMYENRKIDYRLIFVKDTKGNWICKGILGWLGAIGGITIHTLVETNGRTLEDMLKIQFNYNTRQIKKKKQELIDLGTKLASALDTPEKPYMDFGFDFGIDEDEKIWIFEANVHQQLWSPLYLEDYAMYRRIINSVLRYLKKEALV